MINGIERLRRAREILDHSGPRLTDAQPLADAAGECWSAAIDSALWPIELRMKAALVQRMMFRHGAIRTTVDQMNDSEREALRREILGLVDSAETFVGIES